jgi:hypothetical protein
LPPLSFLSRISQAGPVRTLVFAGFNALTPAGADMRRLFAQAAA